MSPSTLQFIIDAFRTSAGGNLSLLPDVNRRKISTADDRNFLNKTAVRNPNGSAMTIIQIANAAGIPTAQPVILDIVRRAGL